MDTMPTLSKQNSPFLTLPAELRNVIYELVCMDNKCGVISTYNLLGISSVQHPLARVCRQLRLELSPLAVEAARNSGFVGLYSKNFDLPPRAVVLDILASLPTHLDWVCIQNVSVDKSLDHTFNARIRKLIAGGHSLGKPGERKKLVSCAVSINIEGQGVDLRAFRSAVEALQMQSWDDVESVLVQGALEGALDKALH